MKEVTIKAYTRRSKSGKSVSVKGYTRRVGRKGVRSPKKTSVEEGAEVIKLKEAKKKYTGPYMTKEEIAAWDKAADRATMTHYGVKKTEKPSSVKPKPTPKKKLRDFEILEDKLANIVDRYSKRKYKRLL